MRDYQLELLIEAGEAECERYTADGIFIEPKNIPDGIETDDWTVKQRQVWEGRFYVSKARLSGYRLYCFDGGCHDRATWRGDFDSVEEACVGARKLAGRPA